MVEDEYTTIQTATELKLVIERSRFIANLVEADTETEAKVFINSIKAKYHQATHNCSAYSIGLPSHGITFFDDDGEPSGSGGKPILGAILRQNLTNVVVVVTRYFGGKKLGIRGLIDAYGGIAEEALVAAGRVNKILGSEIQLVADYEQVTRVMYLIDKYRAKLTASDYGEKVKMSLVIRKSLHEALETELSPYVILVD